MSWRTRGSWCWLGVGVLVIAHGGAWAQADRPLMSRKKGQNLPFVLTAAVRTSQAPELDGTLNDACWAQAGVAGDFVLYGGKGYATEKTEARLLWDDGNLYIGMRCLDSDITKLRQSITGPDGRVFTEDCVEIFFIPPDNPILAKAPVRERYFHLCANARGTRYDEVGYEAPGRWNGRWTVKGAVHKDRWELEFAIPWDTLKTKPTDGTVWAMNFNRGLPARGALREYSGWSLTFAGFHDPEHFGKVIFLDRWPKPGSREVSAAIVARLVRASELDPLLDRASTLLREAGTKLRAVSAKAKARSIGDTLAEVDKSAAEATAMRKALGALSPSEIVATWEARKRRYERLVRRAEALSSKAGFCAGLSAAQLSGRVPIPDVITFIVPAITNDRMLPRRLPSHALEGRTMVLCACPREYESGSFGLYALGRVNGVRLTASDLTGPTGTVPASAVDLRVVKVWYQGGRNVGFQNMKLLTPELLLKDDGLVRIDETRQVNILKMDKDAMRDADTLQPFDVPMGTVKQCWVTVHVPAGTKPGTYRGTIRIAPKGSSPALLPLTLRVWPFELVEPNIICSIYYRAKLGAKAPKCDSEFKTEAQLLAEFRDLRAHGVTNPNVYQGPGPLLQRYFDLRKQAGMHGGPLLTLGVGVGSPPGQIKAAIALAKKNGFDDVYFYAADEASGDRLRSQRALFKKVHAAGGKVFVAGYKDSYKLVGDLLDLPIFAGRPDALFAQAYHAAGHRIGSYANPQGGVEEAETYRRNFGLALWKAGYDCAMTYAYMHSFTHAWDDFDNAVYRDHNMAYPTVNGVIPTIQWEGYREGYDDLRYLATLEDLIERARRLDGPAGEAARDAQVWVLQIDPEGTPLDDIRAGLVERILTIRAALASAAK